MTREGIFQRAVTLSVVLLSVGALCGEIETPPGVMVSVFAEPVPRPLGLSFDSTGALYAAFDEGRSTPIRKISADGLTISLFGPALPDPDSVAVDANDHIYVGSENGLYRLAPDGSSTLVTKTYMGNNTCLAIDHAGVLGAVGVVYVGNARAINDLVRVYPDGTAEPLVIGSALNIPFGLTFGAEALYVAETDSTQGVHRVWADGSMSLVAPFTAPRCVAYNPADGMLYVGVETDETIYRLSPDGGMCAFIRGTVPYGLTFGPGGDLFVSDRSTDPHRILRVSAEWVDLLADINDDCIVNFLDFAYLADAWLTVPGHPQWDDATDIDTPANQAIDIYDLIILVNEWLETVGLYESPFILR